MTDYREWDKEKLIDALEEAILMVESTEFIMTMLRKALNLRENVDILKEIYRLKDFETMHSTKH